MDLLWSVLKHGNLSLLNCTDGGRSSRSSRRSRSCTGHSGRTTLSHCTLAKCSITIMGRNIKGRNYQPSASTPTLLLSSSPAIDWTLLELTGLGQTVESSCTMLLLKRGFSMDGICCGYWCMNYTSASENIAFKDPFHFHFLCSIHFMIANIFQLETDIKKTNTSLSKLPWIKMSKIDILATALSKWLFPEKMQTFQTNATNATTHPLMQAI